MRPCFASSRIRSAPRSKVQQLWGAFWATNSQHWASGCSLPQSPGGTAMEFGYFAMPSHPPERGLKAGHDWDLQTLRWLDELGYQEAWIGEHYTAPWEPHPSPDLLVAQALLQTKNIRIGPGGF